VDLTHSSKEGFLQGLGIQISPGCMCNVQQAEHGWAAKVQNSILQAALKPEELKGKWTVPVTVKKG
jgi:hypothetical protein